MRIIETIKKRPSCLDDPAWKALVQLDAIGHVIGGAPVVCPPIEVNAKPGFDLSVDVKIRTVTEARQETGLAKNV